jgi:hypothetical protein
LSATAIHGWKACGEWWQANAANPKTGLNLFWVKGGLASIDLFGCYDTDIGLSEQNDKRGKTTLTKLCSYIMNKAILLLTAVFGLSLAAFAADPTPEPSPTGSPAAGEESPSHHKTHHHTTHHHKAKESPSPTASPS